MCEDAELLARLRKGLKQEFDRFDSLVELMFWELQRETMDRGALCACALDMAKVNGRIRGHITAEGLLLEGDAPSMAGQPG